MTKNDILITFSSEHKNAEELSKNFSTWIHDGRLLKNDKLVIKKDSYNVGGTGTFSDPFICEYDSFKKYADIARFNGFVEKLSYINRIDIQLDKKFIPENLGRTWFFFDYYYSKKEWKRGNSSFNSFLGWYDLIDNLKILRSMGYAINKHHIDEYLLDLNNNELEKALLKYYKEIWKSIEPRLNVKVSVGDKVKFTVFVYGEHRDVVCSVVKEKNGRFFVISDDEFSVNPKYGTTKKSHINDEDYLYDLLVDHDAKKSKIKIPLFDYKASGNYMFGATKYNNFKIIK